LGLVKIIENVHTNLTILFRYGSCWAFNTGDGHDGGGSVPLVEILRTGPFGGIHLKLNIQQPEYMESTTSAGIRMYVGDQGTYFSILDDGIPLGPGQKYDIELRKSYVNRVDPFRNGSCAVNKVVQLVNHNTRKPFSIAKFTFKFCQKMCASRAILEECGCIHYSMPFPAEYKDKPVCVDGEPEKCADRVMGKWYEGELGCKCYPQCKELIYTTSIASQSYPSEYIRQKERDAGRPDPVKNLLEFTVFFRGTSFKHVIEQEFYNIENLIADLGGQFGLFGGFSFLTAFEFIILIFFGIPRLVVFMLTKKNDEKK